MRARPRHSKAALTWPSRFHDDHSVASRARGPSGESICRCTYKIEHWYQLVSGAARKSALSGDGRLHIVDFILPRDPFGLAANGMRHFCVEALVPGTLIARTMDLLFTKYLKAGGTPIQISVYPEKLMLWNPGELPKDWTVARLKAKHPSRPFNPGVANVFFRAGQIEAWGRGIERIFSACATAGTPPPALRCEQNGLWVDFQYGSAADISSREAGEKTREKTRDKILRLIRVNPDISMETMASFLGLTRKGVEWQVRKLKQAGILRRVGPDKGGHWEILV
jgi:hypothetical protein